MRISDWSSDAVSSDLLEHGEEAHRAAAAEEMGEIKIDRFHRAAEAAFKRHAIVGGQRRCHRRSGAGVVAQVEDLLAQRRVGDRQPAAAVARSEEHTSELQSLMRISYAVFCLKKKQQTKQHT